MLAFDSKLENSPLILAPAPALPSIKFKAPAFFHGEIVQTNPFRGPLGERPPPSVDEAWQQLGVGVPGIRLSGEEVEGFLGKKIVNGTRAMHEVQDGKGGYVAMLEVMHLLHCLVSLPSASSLLSSYSLDVALFWVPKRIYHGEGIVC